MSDARWYAVWPEPKSRSLKGSRPSVPHGTNFLNVILSSCHHSLCMYVCYVYFNIIKINQSIKIHPTKIAGIVLVIVLISGFNSMHLRVVLRRKKV